MRMALRYVNQTRTASPAVVGIMMPIEGVAHVPSALQHATVGMVT